MASCRYRGFSLTAPFPDVVNVILSRLDLAPTCGIGNVDEIIPKIRIAASERLRVPIDQIEVELVAHHALQKYCLNRHSMNSESREKLPPFHLGVTVDHHDVTSQIDAAEILFSAFPISSGPASHFLTAGSTMRLLQAFCSNKKRKRHVPAPGGLPGGYPVWVNDEGCEIRSVPGLSLDQAIAINEKSHQFDGIEKIEVDGTVRIAAEPAEIMRETLGYDCNSVSPAEMEDRADELMKRFKGLAQSHGIPLERMKFGR
jgi:hypothetical protein